MHLRGARGETAGNAARQAEISHLRGRRGALGDDVLQDLRRRAVGEAHIDREVGGDGAEIAMAGQAQSVIVDLQRNLGVVEVMAGGDLAEMGVGDGRGTHHRDVVDRYPVFQRQMQVASARSARRRRR